MITNLIGYQAIQAFQAVATILVVGIAISIFWISVMDLYDDILAENQENQENKGNKENMNDNRSY